MIAKHVKADINVIALIGERGREVKESLRNNLVIKGFLDLLSLWRLPTSPLCHVLERFMLA